MPTRLTINIEIYIIAQQHLWLIYTAAAKRERGTHAAAAKPFDMIIFIIYFLDSEASFTRLRDRHQVVYI